MSTLIIIDDDEANNTLIRTVFREYQVITARTAEMGIQYAREAHPAVILMDIKMPGMDGAEATSIIKHDPDLSATPVIVVTATVGPDLQRALDAGCDGYMKKPYSPHDLKAYVKQFLSYGETS